MSDRFNYSVRQLRLAADYLEGGNVTLAQDCMRRALDGMGDAATEPEYDGDVEELIDVFPVDEEPAEDVEADLVGHDPHCTCNDCMTEFIERMDSQD